MTPYEQCLDELGITCPSLDQKRALRRLVAAVSPDVEQLRRAQAEASEERKRRAEDDARVDVLRDAVERVLTDESCPRRIRRELENAAGATTYDGRTARRIRKAGR